MRYIKLWLIIVISGIIGAILDINGVKIPQIYWGLGLLSGFIAGL